MMIFLAIISMTLIEIANSSFLLCDNDIANKSILMPTDCSSLIGPKDETRELKQVDVAVMGHRNLALDGFGYKCSGYYVQYEMKLPDRSFEKQTITLNFSELECKIMGLIHTYTTEYGRKISLHCNSHATKCMFKEEREPSVNGSFIQKRYSLMVARVELKSNSRGNIVHREEVFDECKVNDKICRVDSALYTWDTNIIQNEGFVLLDHGTYLQHGDFVYTHNRSTENMLFFLTGEWIDQDGGRYMMTTSGLFLLFRDEDNENFFVGILDESKLRSNLKVDKNEIEVQRLKTAQQNYRLFRYFEDGQSNENRQLSYQQCLIYQNQLNIMSSLPNNYYVFILQNGTQVYVYVFNGKLYVTDCEALLSVSEAMIETNECYKYRPVSVYDQKFNRIQAYLFNQFYINKYPEKIPCLKS